MENETFLYFGEDTLGVSATAACYPVSNFISASPSATTKIKLMFKSLKGDNTDDQVELTFTTAKAHAKAMEAIASAMNHSSSTQSNIITIYDGVAGTSYPIDPYVAADGTVTAQAFTAVDITLG